MFRLRDYQVEPVQEMVRILTRFGICYQTWETRTGKLSSSLYCAELLGARSVLYVTKKKNLENALSDFAMVAPSYRFQCINYASVHKVEGVYDLVILDEAHNLGGLPKMGVRAKRLAKLIGLGRSRVILSSATPCPESFGQLFHQFHVAGRGPWTRFQGPYAYYQWFRSGYGDRTATKSIGYGEEVPDWAAVHEAPVMADIAPYVSNVTQADAEFPFVVQDKVLKVPMPDGLKKAYGQMKKNAILRLADGRAAPANGAADEMGKLRQIASGTLKLEDGSSVVLSDYKAAAIKERMAGKRFGLLYYFRAERDLLLRHFPDATEDALAFERGEADVYLGQVRSSREGVKLASADLLVMFTLDYSATSYIQARNRIQDYHRETQPTVVWVIGEGSLELRVLSVVRKKRNYTKAMYLSEKLAI